MDTEAQWISKLKLYRSDPWAFCSDCVYTLDQADESEPIKKFPAHLDYLKLYTRIWQKEKFIAVPKSRRMMFSWMNIILYTWDTMFHIGKMNAFVSKKEEDANELIIKSQFVLDHIPESALPRSFIPRYEVTFGKIKFPEINSSMQGFPQGADQLRQFTFSGILADEMSFWSEAQEMYAASFPTLEGGGRFTAVSSPGPGFFRALVFDHLDKFGGKKEETA